jgi:hypothetical protein
MMKSLASLCLTIVALAVAAPAMSAVKTATFQTTFTILETCRVDGNNATNAAPVVSCQMASSSFVASQSQAQAQASMAAEGTPAWVVTF